MVKGYKIDRNRLGKRPIGCILGSKNDYMFKNIVRGYIADRLVLIKTNMSQSQFDDFCNGKLNKKELHKII